MLATILVVGLGEALWLRFVPKYIELLGGSVWAIAVYGTVHDFLDSVYQYPGGWLSDKLGRRKSLIFFTMLASLGYVVYIVSPRWEFLIAGLFLVMAWTSMSQPGLFAIVGDTLPPVQRSTGFGVLSILKRIPVVVAPVLGGWMILQFGLGTGMRINLAVAVVLALVSVLIVRRFYSEHEPEAGEERSFVGLWRSIDVRLKRLLVADCFARWAEGIPNVFIILYVLDVLKHDALEFGSLTSVEMITAIVVYLPVAKLSDRMHRKPFVMLTFSFFALYPLALVTATSTALLLAAFVVAGLREIGEPARKALIVDLAHPSARGRTIGLYYLLRGFAVFPASLVGGWLWSINKELPFYAAFVAGAVGVLIVGLWRFEDQSTQVTQQ